MKRAVARGRLVEDGTKRELIGAIVGRNTPRLLRRHVSRRAEENAGSGVGTQVGDGVGAGPGRGQGPGQLLDLADLRQPEVENLHEAVLRDHHVLWLQVAVHDAGTVGLGEPVGELYADVERLFQRQRPAVPQRVPQRLPVDELHHDVRAALDLADPVDRDDVGMVERGGRPRLLGEASEVIRIGGEPLGEDLDRDHAGQLEIPCAIDLSHTPGADQFQEFVSAEAGSHCRLHLLRGPTIISEGPAGFKANRTAASWAALPRVATAPRRDHRPHRLGGMGEVYKAIDTRLNRTVAVKILTPNLTLDSHAKQRFAREAHVIAALSHPNICALFDIGEHEGAEFLVMEYLDGETLSNRLARGRLPVDQALRYAVRWAGRWRRRTRRNCSSGPEALERDPDEERRQAARLRAGQAAA